MNTARRRPFHRPLKILPWYVNCTLDPVEARKVAAHVSDCLTCQREIGELVKLFSGRARSLPRRPVEETRLDELFSRIDRYEAQRRETPRAQVRSFREMLSTGLLGWLGARPAMVAGVCAAVVLAVVAIPTLRHAQVVSTPAVDSPYEVLSTDDPVAEQLRVRLRFQTPLSAEAADQWVKSSLAQHKVGSAYRIESGQNGEVVVIFRKKPTVEAVSRLLNDWRGAPDVADAAIDAG